MRKYITFIAVLLGIVLIGAGNISAGVDLSFEHLYTNDEVIAALKQLHQAYPKFTSMQSLGKSEEGRDIWLFTINNPATGNDVDKPGIYVDGTIHGNEIQATEVCLYLIWYLLENYDELPDIKEIVDRNAFYVIPIVNVDSRARFFTDPTDYNYGRTGRVPYDDDRDGLVDEDNLDDLDGDGEILEMRIADPYGGWKSDPDDPRVMIRTKPWEKGEWRRLGEEGLDNDGDGRINEDGPGYLDMNRNYGFAWQPMYVQDGAGDFPMSGKITRALADFILTRPNIVFNYAFHNSGGLWVRGPGSPLAGRYAPSDVRVYDYLGGEGEKIVPGYRYIIGGQDMYTTHGDFDEFMYSNLGIFGFVGELFMSKQEAYRSTPDKPGEGDRENAYYGGVAAKERQEFNDNLTHGKMFRDWKKFNHPQLGEIEIGGWRKFTTRIPPDFMLPEMVHRAASMVIFTAKQSPDISLELLEVKDLGNGLKRIRVRATNETALPSLSAKAVSKSIYRQDILSIEGNGIEVVSGAIVHDLHLDNIQPVEYRPHMIFTSVPSFGKRDVQWIVKGSGKAVISYDGVKAKNCTLDVSL